jgi:chromosome segregation ATPase
MERQQQQRDGGATITGGTINNSGAMALGAKARATQNVSAAADELDRSGRQEVARCLRELNEAIAQLGHRLEDRDEVVQATETLAEEMKKDQPSKLTVRALLDGLATAAGSVGGIAAAVTALRTAVSGLL